MSLFALITYKYYLQWITIGLKDQHKLFRHNSSSTIPLTSASVSLRFILFLRGPFFFQQRSLPRCAAMRIGWCAATSKQMKEDTERHRKNDSNRLWLSKPPAVRCDCSFVQKPVREVSLHRSLDTLDRYCFPLNQLIVRTNICVVIKRVLAQ